MILKCFEGMYVTYTSEIFSDPHRKKKVFVEQYLGLFLTELGLFCHFVPGLLAIALGSRLPLFIWIAGIGLGTRLRLPFTNYLNCSTSSNIHLERTNAKTLDRTHIYRTNLSLGNFSPCFRVLVLSFCI